MSKFTTTLGQLINGGMNIGLQDYPIFNESYRLTLNRKIINHYMYREIGAETPAMFKFYLNREMDEIMPYYNQLYKNAAELEGIDVTENLDWHEDYGEDETQGRELDRTRIGSVTDETNTSGNNVIEQAVSDSTAESSSNESSSKNQLNVTPMGSVSDIYSKQYATQTTQDGNSSNSSSTRDTSGKKDETQTTKATINSETSTNENDKENENKTRDRSYTRKLKGKTGAKTKGEIMIEMRESFINIDMMVISDLESCFMQLW